MKIGHLHGGNGTHSCYSTVVVSGQSHTERPFKSSNDLLDTPLISFFDIES